MKIRRSLAILAGCVLAAVLACSALASGQLPLDIRARFGSIEITDTAYWDSPESTWFVLIRTPDGTNMLLCFVLERGMWTQKFQTDAAIPQGSGRVRILFSGRVRESANGRDSVQPILMITQYGTGDGEASAEVQEEFLRSSGGEWNLIRAYFAKEQVSLEISEDAVTFSSPAAQDPEQKRTVRIETERDLRRLDLGRIPLSPEEAESLSLLPED